MDITYKPVVNIKKVESLNDILGFIKRNPNDIEEYSQEEDLVVIFALSMSKLSDGIR